MSALAAVLPLGAVVAALLALGWPSAGAAALGLGVAVAVLALAGGTAEGTGGMAGTALALGVAAEAGHTTLTILWILLPALALHALQLRTGAADRIRDRLARMTADPVRQALLIAWFFGLFVEGAAGFGTPVALAAPLLVAAGFAPLSAVVLALVGHAAGVAFGAVGTPTLTQAALTGLPPGALAGAVAGANLVLGWVPLLAVAVLARGGWPTRADLGWTGLAGLAFLLPHAAIARVAGPELATLGAALVGLVLFVAVLRGVRHGRARDGVPGAGGTGAGERSVLADLAPYLALVALVLVTRLVPPLREALAGWTIGWALPGGFAGTVQPLFHPGTLLMAALLAGAVLSGRAGAVGPALAEAAGRLVPVALALVLMLALSRLMVHGGMIAALAEGAAGAGAAWPAVAAAVGVLGSFVTGSATASNILFAEFQVATAGALGLSALWLSAAQGLGAAIGNLVAPHNIIAGCATVGLVRADGQVLRRTVPLCAVYLVLTGALMLWLVGG